MKREAMQGESSLQPDPATLAKDNLFNALRHALPGASHDQLLDLIRAMDRYVAVKINEWDAL